MSKAAQYYTLYLGLGEGRSLARLAEVTGKSEAYLTNVSSKNNWKQRLAEDTQVVVEEVKARYHDRKGEEMLARLTLAERIYKIIEESLDRIPVNTVADLKRLVEIMHILEGKPTSITKDISTPPEEGLSDEELNEMLDAILAERLASKGAPPNLVLHKFN